MMPLEICPQVFLTQRGDGTSHRIKKDLLQWKNSWHRKPMPLDLTICRTAGNSLYHPLVPTTMFFLALTQASMFSSAASWEVEINHYID